MYRLCYAKERQRELLPVQRHILEPLPERGMIWSKVFQPFSTYLNLIRGDAFRLVLSLGGDTCHDSCFIVSNLCMCIVEG